RPPHRVLTIVMALAVAALGIGFAVWALSHENRQPAASPSPGPAAKRCTAATRPGWRAYCDPEFGWWVDYPVSLRLGRFSSSGMFESEGVRLTNFAPDLSTPSSGEPPMGWLRTFP